MTGARHAVVAALAALAESADHTDRADAGRALAPFADLPEARQVLLELLLDHGDTYVTLVTAEAVLRRGDTTGLAMVAAALGAEDVSRAEWIGVAVREVFSIRADERDEALRRCHELAADDRLRVGTRELADMLAELDPILGPPLP